MDRKRRKAKIKKAFDSQKETKKITRNVDFTVPQVNEPCPNCIICNQTINLISEAISEENGQFSHFDCVLKKIEQNENVTEPDKVSYVGHGEFAIVSKNELGNFFIKTRIPYESKERYENMKKFVEGVKS